LVTNRGTHGPNKQQELLLNRLTPHLIKATEISFRLGHLELEISKRDFMLDQHPTPLWLLDSDCHVVYANHAAVKQVSQSKFELYERFGRLHSNHMDARLHHHVQKAFGKNGPKQASRLRLSNYGKDLLVVPVDADAPLNQLSHRPLVLVAYLSGQLQIDLLASLFQLSPAEQRLADLLCQGHPPETCASILNVSINTVRSQLRALFRKTETERQAELVGLLTRIKV
jgi:DNA-binding CsgD family transcriptional regulator